MSTTTKRTGIGAIVAVIALALLVITALVMSGGSKADAVNTVSSAKPSPTASATPDQDYCPAQFVQRDLTDKELSRLAKDGIDAKSADVSSEKNLTMLGHQAKLLQSVAASQFKIKDVPVATKMLNADETCLSEAGQRVHHDLGVVMNASTKSFEDVPANAYNSGAKDGGLVVAKSGGIRGNLKAIKYTLPDGSVAWTLVRCGNPVFVKPPQGVPNGPTDNPPPPKTPKCPPGQHGTPPICKDGPERLRTNADGAGHRADPGPGAYVAPKDMDQPSSTPRVDPVKPKPKPPSTPTKPKPEPTFTHPAPEPSAPKPDKPETGCKVIPGVEDCK